MRVGSRGIEYTGHVGSGVFRKSVRDERACTIVKSTSGPDEPVVRRKLRTGRESSAKTFRLCQAYGIGNVCE